MRSRQDRKPPNNGLLHTNIEAKMPTLLDLYCGAGLAADGYVKAGFEVFGVDINLQPNYPYAYFQDDALKMLDDDIIQTFDVIHASPPCQLFTRAGKLRDAQGGTSKYLDLLTPTIKFLREYWNHKIWVVENVPGAKDLMPGAVTVCGSAFGLEVQRHRLFLSNKPIVGTKCDHSKFPIDEKSGKPRPWGVYHVPSDNIPAGGRTAHNAAHAAQVMGLDRALKWDEIKEGIPPAYTEYIGKQLLEYL